MYLKIERFYFVFFVKPLCGGTSLPYHPARWKKEQTIPMARSCGVYDRDSCTKQAVVYRAYRGQGHRHERSCDEHSTGEYEKSCEALHELRAKETRVYGPPRWVFLLGGCFLQMSDNALKIYCCRSYTPCRFRHCYHVPNMYDPNIETQHTRKFPHPAVWMPSIERTRAIRSDIVVQELGGPKAAVPTTHCTIADGKCEEISKPNVHHKPQHAVLHTSDNPSRMHGHATNSTMNAGGV